ncbi:hypothetical protein [Streptomyces sp. NRRL S-87]|uniref:hypothetical protein n=1 Tax=Streptomyces sp. NRRL S-87 TaxID=1463920 RepID=UPI000ADC1408|nr:hypothetical protein [Streptomyces sp. NRRL S-87]
MATNFEGYSHQALLDMLESANAATAKDLGTQLTEAARTIKEIGEDLKAHAPKVVWEGEGGDAFREWVNATGNATLRLGEYSATGGTWMTNAAQTIVEVKANMPARDAAAKANLDAAHAAPHDPDSAQIARDARAKLDGDHAQAVQQMNKLAQSYEASSQAMNRAEAPTFPPPPATFLPVDRYGEEAISRPDSDYAGSSGAPSGRGSGTDGPNRAPGVTPGSPGGPGAHAPGLPAGPGPSHPAPAPAHPGSTVPDDRVDVGIDRAATLPGRADPPSLHATPPGGTGPGGAGIPPAPAAPPVFVPPNTRPGPGGGHFPPANGVRPPAPPVTGAPGRIGSGPSPVGRDSGIVGGRQVPAGKGPAAGIPRGTVIGGEPGQAGRAQEGYARAGGAARAGVPNSPVGAGQQGRSSATGRPFTQGGSGLVRGQSSGAPSGLQGMRSTSPQSQSGTERERPGNRPDYLAEDEETWLPGNRRVVPPVID